MSFWFQGLKDHLNKNSTSVWSGLIGTIRDGQIHFFRELDHSRSLPKKSEPRSLTLMNFLFSKI